MLDAFLRVEDDLDYGGDGLHGRGGPLRSPPGRHSAICRRSTRAMTNGVRRSGTRRRRLPRAPTPPASAARAHDARRPPRLDQRRVPGARAARGRTSTVRGDVARRPGPARRAACDRACDPAPPARRSTAREVIVERRGDPLPRDPAALGGRRRRRLARRREPQGPRGDPGLRGRARSPRARMRVAGRAGLHVDAAVHLRSRRRRTERHADDLVRRGRRRPTTASRAARLIGAVMRVFSMGEVRLAVRRSPLIPSSSSACCRTTATRAGCATACAA